MSSPQQIKTTATQLFNIKHPILLAGMGSTSGGRLAAAITNAGGMGIIGGNGYTPEMLREEIVELKSHLHDKNAPFGVDLLIPQIGGNARKTNYDYNKGKFLELIDVMVETGCKLFVCAIGIPPQDAVDKLHKNGILYMNMVGHPKHVNKALDRGADLICAQGGEGGGHTGDVPLSVLIPEVVRLCDQKISSFTGKPVQVIAAGGISNGQTLAASLMLGASAVWIGTRFILAEESNASQAHRDAVQSAGFDDNIRTIIFSGRPLRVRNSPYINDWETNRQAEIKDLTSKGILPVEHDFETKNLPDDVVDQAHPFLMGKVSAVVDELKPAKAIVDEIIQGAVERLNAGNGLFVAKSKM
ncbi:oxidoreductase [Tothia fuscella]|uniref:Oxidoreductase n=1 Tax=Tothia fuscella TaxID=1048955 RepID=A0A9P4TTV8_9PEZI|nr:oxidoreductase [Tothia fuscella]